MAAAAPASSDPQEGQAMAWAEAEVAEASIRSLVPVKVQNILGAFYFQGQFHFLLFLFLHFDIVTGASGSDKT